MTATNFKALESALFTVGDDRLAGLLERGLGLAPTPANLAAFIEQCHYRAKALAVSDEAYFELLSSSGPSARTEWIALAPGFTLGGAVFFWHPPVWEMIE